MKYIFSLLLSVLIAVPALSQIVIKGKVKDAKGKMPGLAHAHIGNYGEDLKKSLSYECAKDGSFRFTVPNAGIYSLRLSAADHEEVSIDLMLDEKDKSVEINARLNANPFNKVFEKVNIIGDWNKFAFSGNDVMNPKQTPSGKTIYTYEREATGDTLSYQLLGIAGGHSVNGTQSDYLSYDGGGDYRSVIRTKKGEKVSITFDPSKINFSPSSSLPKITIENNPFLMKATALSMKVAGMHTAPMTAEKHDVILAAIKEEFMKAKSSGDTKYIQYAGVTLASEYDPEFPFSTDNAALIVNNVPASSAFWAMATEAAIRIAGLTDKSIGQAYKNDLKKNPERSVRAVALGDEMMHAIEAKDTKEWKRVYAMLKSEYGDVPELKWTLLQNNPDALVQVGNPVLPFEVTLLDGGGKVSNTSMLGKYYMIDFWATWCGPCVREMPAIHKAYEKFKGRKGFEIVSLSMDAAEANIAPFRAKKWKMPWLHAFIPGIFEAELAKKFEVAGIPKPVLVGPDGKIIAMQEELRGEELEKTLTKFLGESN